MHQSPEEVEKDSGGQAYGEDSPCLQQDNLYGMDSVKGQGGKRGGGVMNPVKLPQQRDPMGEAMDPIAADVTD